MELERAAAIAVDALLSITDSGERATGEQLEAIAVMQELTEVCSVVPSDITVIDEEDFRAAQADPKVHEILADAKRKYANRNTL
jgi:hypothetical protein